MSSQMLLSFLHKSIFLEYKTLFRLGRILMTVSGLLVLSHCICQGLESVQEFLRFFCECTGFWIKEPCGMHMSRLDL